LITFAREILAGELFQPLSIPHSAGWISRNPELATGTVYSQAEALDLAQSGFAARSVRSDSCP
jgi:hypothetical protein